MFTSRKKKQQGDSEADFMPNWQWRGWFWNLNGFLLVSLSLSSSKRRYTDSNDKLKTYGIARNGCIGEYSHLIIWLDAFKQTIILWYLLVVCGCCYWVIRRWRRRRRRRIRYFLVISLSQIPFLGMLRDSQLFLHLLFFIGVCISPGPASDL